VLGLLFVAAALPGSAYNPANGRLVTYNPTSYQVWITVYNAFRHQMGSSWLQPRQTDYWNNCCYSAGSIYYVRAEVKKTENGQMSQIADTTIKVVPRLCRTPHINNNGDPYGYGRVVLRHSGGNHFYWDRDDIVEPGDKCMNNR
jgi:hypothetical protein